MTDNAEWGPWIEHDGRGCPCVGRYVHIVRLDAPECFAVAGSECMKAEVSPNDERSAWVWMLGNAPSHSDVIRYRIRKPRALKQLRDLVENLPPPTERVDA